MKGITLIKNIKKGIIDDNSEIEIQSIVGERIIIKYIDNELVWEPNTFRVSMLYSDDYDFNVIKEKKIEKLKLVNGGVNGRELINTINEIVDEVNKLKNDRK